MKKALFVFVIIFSTISSFKAFSQWNFERALSTSSYYINFSDFTFSLPQNGYVIYTHPISPSSGNIVSVVKTTDYLSNWDVVGGAGGSYYSSDKIFSTALDTVFYLLNWEGVCSLKYSFNGGQTWSSQGLGLNWPGAMFFLNGHCGYFITQGYNTPKLWKYTPDSLSVLIYSDTIDMTTSRIFFTDTLKGYITAKDTSGNSLLLRTEDGGLSWNTQFSTSQYAFNDFEFTSSTIGYIACDSGAILKTVDGGISFTELSAPTQVNLLDLDFVNDSCGSCVGLNGVIIRTVDGGQNWITETISTTSELKKIQLFDQNTGYILSSDHKIYSKGIYESVETFYEKFFEVYPNPADDNLFVSLSDQLSENGFKCSLYNCQGVLLYSMEMTTNNALINVQDLPAGIYYLTVVSDKMQHTERVMVY